MEFVLSQGLYLPGGARAAGCKGWGVGAEPRRVGALWGAPRDGEPRLRGLQSRPWSNTSSWPRLRWDFRMAAAPKRLGLRGKTRCWGFWDRQRWEQPAPSPFKELLSSAKVRWYHLGTPGRLGTAQTAGLGAAPAGTLASHRHGCGGSLHREAGRGGLTGSSACPPRPPTTLAPPCTSPARPSPVSGGF